MDIEFMDSVFYMIARIHSIETLGAVDGPGIRFVAFMQGCPLRCAFCHNPDTWEAFPAERPTETDSSSLPQSSHSVEGGGYWTAEELMAEVLRYKNFIRKGGVTLSGGEPLLQARFAKEFFALCRQNGIHTALDTSGAVFTPEARAVMDYTDLVLLDIKTADDTLHPSYVGAERTNNRRWFDYLLEIGKPIWVRHVVVPGYTDNEVQLKGVADYLQAYLPIIERIELLPYHSLGKYKYEKLGLSYRLAGVPDLTQEEINRVRTQFRQWLPNVTIS